MKYGKTLKGGKSKRYPAQPWAKRKGNKAIRITKKELELQLRKEEEENKKAENLFRITGGGGVFSNKVIIKRKHYKRFSTAGEIEKGDITGITLEEWNRRRKQQQS